MLILQMAGRKFGKTMPVNWYTVTISLCHFFQSDMYVAGLNSKDQKGLIRKHISIWNGLSYQGQGHQ